MSVRLQTFLIFIPAYAATSVGYLVVGQYTSGGTLYAPATSLDEAIPFVPELVFAYITLYLLPVILILATRTRRQLKEVFVAYLIVNAIAFPIYLVYPVHCPKPVVDTETISGWVLAMEHSWDTPMNSLPSLHACVALLVYFCCRDAHVVLSWVLLATAIVIGISALLVKQHYIADIISGFALAWLAYALATRLVARLDASVDR